MPSTTTPAAPRAGSRTYRPAHDGTRARAVQDFLLAKGGQLRPAYATLCIVYWVERVAGRAAVCAADVRVLFPRRGDAVAGRLRSASDLLCRARDDGLIEALGSGWYRMTPRGAAVVDALPDQDEVAAVRGCRSVRCAARPRWIAH
jgi:hypothetical protein